jgi:carbamate kinase
MSKILIALGGNALGKSPSEQLELVKGVSSVIVSLVEMGNEVVITHGNGPQVGMINLAFDNDSLGFSMPFAECNAMSEGYIGYHLQQSITNELKKRSINKNCVSVITQVIVDKNDKAFLEPTKPIGNFYTKEESERLGLENNYVYKEDAGRGYRRVVASPEPIDIVEKESINSLINDGNIVIAVGGGGIPVINDNGILTGVDAVIDKDLSSSLLARLIDFDMLIILTNVEKVYLNYNEDNEIGLDTLYIDDALKYISNGEFAKGSMLPKIEACISFVKETNKQAIITSLLSAKDALEGKTGTLIK